MKQKEAEYADKYANADQQTIGNIKDNYERNYFFRYLMAARLAIIAKRFGVRCLKI